MLGAVLTCRTSPTLDGHEPLLPHDPRGDGVWGPALPGAVGQCCGPGTQHGRGSVRLGRSGSRHARRRTRRWQLSRRDGARNPPHGSHYHLYLVKKLSSWMCLILITPYRTGPLQTGQTDRRGLLLPRISAQAAPGRGGRGHPFAPNPSARPSFKRGFAVYSLRRLRGHYRGQHLIQESLVKK